MNDAHDNAIADRAILEQVRGVVRFYRHDGTEATWAYGHGTTNAERYASAREVIAETSHCHKWGLGQ